MNKKYFIIFIFLMNLFFLSFDLFKINSYYKITYFIPVLSILNQNSESINKELDANVKFFNSVVFNTNSFLFSRESKRKGFVRDVSLEIREVKIDYKIESYEFVDGFYYIFKINVPLDDKRKERISNFMKISGLLSYGEGSENIFIFENNSQNDDKKDTLFIYTFKNSIIDLINNAIIMKYGRNFLLDLRGSFIITEQPYYIIKSGNLYIKIKGMVFFENN